MKRGRKPRTEPTDRERAMAAAYTAGKTLNEIGQVYGITRERVRQLLTHRFGITAQDERSLKLRGCTFAQYALLRAMRKPVRAYSTQKGNAGRRGIPWELTLWQWWTIWRESGRWDQRGRGQGYVMCRKGDVGPYSVSNVVIALAAVNSSEAQQKKRKDPGLPIGVSRTKSQRFVASRRINGKDLRLGTFETPELAHAAYVAADQQVAA